MTRNYYNIFEKVQRLKAKHHDSKIIVLVQDGDRYEAYDKDADEVTAICGLGQYAHDGYILNVTGFEISQLDYFLPKLIKAGKRVLIYGLD